MNEEENIEDPLPGDNQTPEEIIPEPTVKPLNDLKDLNDTNDSMEVHKHPHNVTHKKKWGEYLLEFFMLFLAVFLGFLAEYQLEHKIEKDRAKELAKSFYEELKNDSVAVTLKVKERIRQENALAYLEKYFRDSSLTNVSKDFELNFSYGLYFRSLSLFEPRTVVLEQLKNSGSLRYFKNEELQKLIGDLLVAIHNIADRQALETQLRMDHINPVIMKLYDFTFEDQLTHNRQLDIFTATVAYEKSNEFIPFHIQSPGKLDRGEMANLAGFYGRAGMGSTRRIHYQRYIEVNAQLLKALRKEYHLE